ncbi:Lrp/AsnC family transcriptional regulator [Mesorhizobium sp. BAC0120]|uniref:Lrp/AsnC family transcriptional regulator n=1 Tax=Mesorhizobium sp. BAC0120 TaxID=3090670 RepID=UPI00298C0E60|nr:Lrp/AsnC family transcriptional regulator [Mesorhizobium sp. BAC0120]MDW6020722.1 Lrp/AsnC family transcriptional regulator [Mesorhizobium sp. BAC0120]
MKRLPIENDQLDAVDLRIVRTLLEDARTSVAEIARKVKMSAPSVAERMRRLEENGTIQGYSATINPAALGLPLGAWLRVRPVPGELGRVVEILRDIPEVATCDRVTGEDCFIARVQVRSVADLERVIDRIIPYAMTNTAIVQSSPVPSRLPLPGNGSD